MEYQYQDLIINYQILGEGDPVILLHGWGTNLATFSYLAQNLSIKYKVYSIDLIGFGLSDEPHQPLYVSDYVEFLCHFINFFQIKNPIILGHSFGGRIAIKYASFNNNICKLILVDSAGIKKRFNIKKWLSIYKFKIKKWWYKSTKNIIAYNALYEKNGSSDYKNASPVMKGTLSKVVSEDLRKDMRKINVETLIIWGRDDQTTPYSDGLKIHKIIKNSGMVVFDNAGHFPYLEVKKQFQIVINKYLGVENK